MIVKVKYEETVERQAQVEVDEDEFMEFANLGYAGQGGRPFTSITEALGEEPNLLKEFFEAGGMDSWAVANDPSGLGYDQNLLEATL